MKEHILTMTRHILTRAWLLIAVLALSTSSAVAQTALNTTTLSAAITTVTQGTVAVASATGITAPGNGSTLVYLLVDRELLYVQSISGTTVGFTRGASATRATTHLNAAAVTVVPAQAINSYIPSGQCTRTNLAYVPWIVGGAPGVGTEVGTAYDCLGLTTAGAWVRTDAIDRQVVGTTMASTAGVLGAFTGTIFVVSGTNAITGFTNPAGIQPGFTVSIIPSGAFTWTAAGNIALAGTAVVNKILQFMWSGTKWVPSYIA